MYHLYVLQGCPYCKGALDFMNQRGLQHKVITVSPDKKAYYKKKNGMNTFPQIFLDKQPIGGFGDLMDIFKR